jgi:hypothetical protein
MKAILLAAAALALAVTGAAAAPKAHKADTPRAKVLVGPDQPIPYARMQAYSKASAKARATTDWWSASAFSSNASSTTRASSALATAAAPAPR